jgi:hypothetical protein
MAKFCANSVLDAALGQIAAATRLLLLPAQPADLAAAEATQLGEVTLDAGDFALSAGAVSGRRVTVAAQSLEAGGSGTVTHLGLVTSGALLYVTTTDALPVSPGATVNVPAWTIELRAPE